MISAHASLSKDEHFASSESPLAELHSIERMLPGDTVQAKGEIRVPLSRINPIRKGDIALFVPLARLRIDMGDSAMVQTIVIGQHSPRGAGLQPFRLDLGPRIYRDVTQKTFL